MAYPAVIARGHTDRRLMLFDQDISGVFRSRDADVFSWLMKEAWHHAGLCTRGGVSSNTGDAHISFVGNITSRELRRNLAKPLHDWLRECFIWVYVENSKVSRDPNYIPQKFILPLRVRLR